MDVCFSGEQFWSELKTKEKIAGLRQTFHDLGVKVEKIVIYFRNQPDWVESYYAQKCRENTFNFKKYDPIVTAKCLNYFNTVDLWKSVFIESQFILRPFQPSSWINGSIIDDFFYYSFGLNLKEKSNLEATQSRNVTSCDAFSMYFTSLLLQHLPKELLKFLPSRQRFESAIFRVTNGIMQLKPLYFLNKTDGNNILASLENQNKSFISLTNKEDFRDFEDLLTQNNLKPDEYKLTEETFASRKNQAFEFINYVNCMDLEYLEDSLSYPINIIREFLRNYTLDHKSLSFSPSEKYNPNHFIDGLHQGLIKDFKSDKL